MSLGAWIIAGLITGVIAARLLNASALGHARDILLGVVGATIGGELFNRIWPVAVEAVSIPSVLFSAIGAILMLSAFHLSRRSAG